MKRSTYLIIENRTKQGTYSLPDFAIVGCRANKPPIGKDQVAVKVNIELPDNTFKSFIPEVNITIPDELLIRGGDVEVTAVDPEES